LIAPRRRIGVALAVFVVTASAYVALGNAVSHVPPFGIDRLVRPLANVRPHLAWIFTYSCLWPVLTAYAAIGIVIAIRSPAWRGRIVFAITTTLVTWQVSDVLKNVFRRPRPPYWVLHHETSFSYSSGHAMFAVLVYWLWAWFIARSNLPRGVRTVVVPSLAAWGCGVIWSRLSLGAHYPSDLLGGVLLAVAMLALATAVTTGLRRPVWSR
jgi:membrane-associated phospholipid phosphatase